MNPIRHSKATWPMAKKPGFNQSGEEAYSRPQEARFREGVKNQTRGYPEDTAMNSVVRVVVVTSGTAWPVSRIMSLRLS